MCAFASRVVLCVAHIGQRRNLRDAVVVSRGFRVPFRSVFASFRTVRSPRASHGVASHARRHPPSRRAPSASRRSPCAAAFAASSDSARALATAASSLRLDDSVSVIFVFSNSSRMIACEQNTPFILIAHTETKKKLTISASRSAKAERSESTSPSARCALASARSSRERHRRHDRAKHERGHPHGNSSLFLRFSLRRALGLVRRPAGRAADASALRPREDEIASHSRHRAAHRRFGRRRRREARARVAASRDASSARRARVAGRG